MTEENISQQFRLKNIDKIKNYFIKENNQNELVSDKRQKVCAVLNYIEHLLFLVSATTVCVSNYVFVCLVGIPVGITSSTLRLKICSITAGIKNYKSIIKKKEEEET